VAHPLFKPLHPGFLPPISITPPSTRKRKAAEAAITDDQPHTESATKAAHGDPPLVGRSRKPKPKPASTGPATTCPQSTESGNSTSSTGLKKRELATPATTEASMDSDDDFMSDVSSQDDFLDMQGSDDESLGEGTYLTETGLRNFPSI
jgi:ariadne-1